jgi:hypothetical protein
MLCRERNPIGSDLETKFINLKWSANPARFRLFTLECAWLSDMAQSLVGSKNNLLHRSSEYVGVDGFVK